MCKWSGVLTVVPCCGVLLSSWDSHILVPVLVRVGRLVSQLGWDRKSTLWLVNPLVVDHVMQKERQVEQSFRTSNPTICPLIDPPSARRVASEEPRENRIGAWQ